MEGQRREGEGYRGEGSLSRGRPAVRNEGTRCRLLRPHDVALEQLHHRHDGSHGCAVREVRLQPSRFRRVERPPRPAR